MYQAKRIAVVIPAFNEERHIQKVLQGLPSYIDFILVVDDGSEDRTFWKAQRSGMSGLIVLRHPKRLGVGTALATGMKHAVDLEVDIVLTMDADGQMSPKDIPGMLSPLIFLDFDVAKGNRFCKGRGIDTMPWIRRIANRILTKLQAVALGSLIVKDSQCGFTAWRSLFLKRLNFDAFWPTFGIYNYLIFKAFCLGGKIINVDVQTSYGSEQSYVRMADFWRILSLIASFRREKKLIQNLKKAFVY